MNTETLAINGPSSFHWIAVMSEFLKEIPEWLAILLQKSDDLIILQISYCLFWKGLKRKTPTHQPMELGSVDPQLMSSSSSPKTTF